MRHIFFPYKESPNQIKLVLSALSIYWEMHPEEVVAYLISDNISPDSPIIKEIEALGIPMNLSLLNKSTNPHKDIYSEFKKIGWNLDVLKLIDPHAFYEIDHFTLGDIALGCADLMGISASTAVALISYNSNASEVNLKLSCNSIIPIGTTVHLENLKSDLGVVGLNDARSAPLGEIDSRKLGEIDATKITFIVFYKIPALLK